MPNPVPTCPRCGQALSAAGLCPRCGAEPRAEGVEEFDQQVAQLAVRLRLLTPAQAAEALAAPAGEAPGARFAAQLAPEQLRRLTETVAFKCKREADNRLGSLAVARGWAQPDQINRALEEQKRLFLQEKRPVPLGELLVTHHILTRAQCDELLAVQQKARIASASVPAAAPAPAAGAVAATDDEPSFELTVTPDRLSAGLALTHGSSCTPEQLRRALAARGIIYGLDEAALKALCAGETTGSVTVARGLPPVPPRDAQIEYMFDTSPLKGARESEDGTIDYRDRGDIPQVAAGTLLARRIPAVAGTGGVDIFGAPIPYSAPRERPLAAGKGVLLAPDKLSITAAVDGFPAVSATGLVSVHPEYVIKGDLGYKTGHVDFEGRVVVTGVVQSGFRVRCGDLQAQEIEGAEVEADGDVVVSGGIIRAHIRAGGSVQARYLHQSRLEVMGDVRIAREVVESEVETSGEFRGERAILLASRISALRGVFAKEIGSETSSPCRIAVGVDERVLHEEARLLAAMDEKREACSGHRTRLSALAARRGELEAEIGKAAQLQDKALVRRRELAQGAKGPGPKAAQQATELAALEPQVARLEQLLDRLFTEQDANTTATPQIEAQLATDEAALAALQAELDQLRAWAAEHAGLPQLACDLLHQQTLLRTPHLESRVAADRKRVRLEEREQSDAEGRSFWLLRDA